jgi:hypothetical protein
MESKYYIMVILLCKKVLYPVFLPFYSTIKEHGLKLCVRCSLPKSSTESTLSVTTFTEKLMESKYYIMVIFLLCKKVYILCSCRFTVPLKSSSCHQLVIKEGQCKK